MIDFWQNIWTNLWGGQNVRRPEPEQPPLISPPPVPTLRPAAPPILKKEYASPHFKWTELQCKGDCKECSYALEFGGPVANVSEAALEKLEMVRAHTGPFSPNSCCRCPIHNRREGGRPRSQHVSTADQAATAFDVPLVIPKTTLIQAAVDAGFGGIGVNYRTFVHIDDRGYKARW